MAVHNIWFKINISNPFGLDDVKIDALIKDHTGAETNAKLTALRIKDGSASAGNDINVFVIISQVIVNDQQGQYNDENLVNFSLGLTLTKNGQTLVDATQNQALLSEPRGAVREEVELAE